ncbi:NAD-dependent epimerase/dehydratase family protein [Rhizobium sp. RAF56]|jgi:nucleoside-diphosphate-sugar epimerase|uniref:NAD-dependent epimerase/dehydratase family protein n=1 Tax=Rhizobium sp. RAF56 TaxID=3233062 RepID=UPI003F9AADD7
MRVLVSGGTGLVGRYIVEELAAHGYQLIVGSRRDAVDGLFSRPIRFVPLTLDPDAHQTATFEGIDAFVHCAFSHVPGKYRGGEGLDPASFRRFNLHGTISLFEAAKRAGVGTCVFLSSRAVYGDGSQRPGFSEDDPVSPSTLYGEIKQDGERALAALGTSNFVTASLRATGVYGDLRPNKWDGLLADYLAGRPVASRGGTEVHGRDLARAVRLMLETDAAEINGQAFNVSDVWADTHDILKIVRDLSQSPHPLPAGVQPTEIAMDCTKIRARGWAGGGLPLFEDTIRQLCHALAPGRP